MNIERIPAPNEMYPSLTEKEWNRLPGAFKKKINSDNTDPRLNKVVDLKDWFHWKRDRQVIKVACENHIKRQRGGNGNSFA